MTSRITVVVELQNSKVDPADYQGDRTVFGAAVIDGVGSPPARDPLRSLRDAAAICDV
jgi:hypothetical protein